MQIDLLAAELVRMGTDFTFLRRSFTADMAEAQSLWLNGSGWAGAIPTPVT